MKKVVKKREVAKPNKDSNVRGFRRTEIAILIVFVAVTVWVIGFSLQVSTRCEDQACFDERLRNCHRTSFTGGINEVVYEYSIEGRSGDFCIVNVELLQGQLNEQNSVLLEGKEMTCSIPLGLTVRPESEIKDCHGELKEGLQEVIIENLHTYIIGNLDKINDEINS